MATDRQKILHTLAMGRRIKMNLDSDTNEWSAEDIAQGYQQIYNEFWGGQSNAANQSNQQI